METIDRAKMSRLVLEPLQTAKTSLTDAELHAAIAATAEGYSFPTNLDTDPPVGGLAPKTQAMLLKEAVTENWSDAQFDADLRAQDARKEA